MDIPYTVAGSIGVQPSRPFWAPLYWNPWEVCTEFWLCDSKGRLLSVLGPDVYVEADYSLSVNASTDMMIVLPPDFDYDLIQDDGWVLPMRRIGNRPAYLDGDAPFLIVGRGRKLEEKGGRLIVLFAQRAITILGRRIVAYSSEGPQSRKTATVGTILYEVMNENFGAGALETARNVSSWIDIRNIAFPTAGSSISVEISRKIVLDALTEVVQSQASQGSEWFFDVTLRSWRLKKLQFTYSQGRRGSDRTRRRTGAITLSSGNGNITNVQLIEDFTGSYNFVYARGQGKGNQTLTTSVSDAALIGRGPFARREILHSSNQIITPTALVEEGRSALRQGRPRQYFTASVPEVSQYGTRWKFGDELTAEHEGRVFDVHAQSVGLSVSEGLHRVSANLRATVKL